MSGGRRRGSVGGWGLVGFESEGAVARGGGWV